MVPAALKTLARTRPVTSSAVAFLCALTLGLVVSFLVEFTREPASVGRGVSLRSPSGTTPSLTNRHHADLTELFAKRNQSIERTRFKLVYAQSHLIVSGAELGLSIDVEKESLRALHRGKESGAIGGFFFWCGRLFSDVVLEETIHVDRVKLGRSVGAWIAKVLPTPKDPSISFEKTLLVFPGQAGTMVTPEALQTHLLRALRVHRFERDPKAQAAGPIELELPTEELPLPVSEEVVRTRAKEAEALVRGGITVSAPEGQKFTLSPAQLGAALSSQVVREKQNSLTLILSPEKLRASLEPWLKEVEKPALDAAFEFPARGEILIAQSAPGVRIDESALVTSLFAASRTKERRAELKLTPVPPKLTRDEALSLGVKELVFSFTTHHACCQPRVENIHTAAAVLDGTVLRAGETFSLNQTLGPRGPASGYRAAPTIVHGDMQDMLGGGISQLATTLFNAVLRGGYEIIQRQPHSVYFPRYPEGHEATVSFPEPDLIFKNDTQAGMVIRTEYTPTFIKVLIYGDAEGRTTVVSKSPRYSIVEPPKEYEPDPEMPPDKAKRLRAGQLGWSLRVSRTVTFKDGQKKKEEREVVYNPRPELLRVHPCVIPEGEEGHTGEECPEPEEEEREEHEEDLSDVYYETLDSD